MRTDAYTKFALTVIAVMLTLLVYRPLVGALAKRHADAASQNQIPAPPKGISWEGVLITHSDNAYDFTVLDTKTGDYWEYIATHGSCCVGASHAVPPSWTYLGRISGPGGSISNWKQWFRGSDVPIPPDAPDVVTYKP